MPFRASGVRRALGPPGKELGPSILSAWGGSMGQSHRFAGANAKEMVKEGIVPQIHARVKERVYGKGGDPKLA